MKLISSKKIMSGLALAGAMILTGIVGLAQQETTPGEGRQERAGRHWQRGGGKGKHGLGGGLADHFAQKLNLTEAQKEQMRQITARYQESAKAQRQQSGAGERRRGFDAFNGGTFDEAAVRAAAQARANARVEVEVAHARMMSEMYNVLTPEQKAQLAAERQQREQKRQERRALRGATSSQSQ